MAAETGIRGFARRKGVHPAAVEKSIKNGRLERSVRPGARGPRINVEIGDVEWEQNRDSSKDRAHNHAKPGKRLLTLDDLHPAVSAVYKLRGLLETLTDAVFEMQGSEADCAAILDAIQKIPVHLRTIENGLAEAGVPLFENDMPRRTHDADHDD